MLPTVLFGTRSALVVDFEETCQRAGIEISSAVNLGGPTRLLNPDLAVDLDVFRDHESQYLPVAFDPKRRREIAKVADDLGLPRAPALVDPTAIVARSCRIGDGSFVNAGAVFGGVVMTGDAVLINRSASIGHHCVIGAFASIGPGATLASNCRVGEGVVIAAGAVLLPGVVIGDGALVAAGAVVRHDVSERAFVAGNPAVQKDLGRAPRLTMENQE